MSSGVAIWKYFWALEQNQAVTFKANLLHFGENTSSLSGSELHAEIDAKVKPVRFA